jgi:CHAT domain-containing protein
MTSPILELSERSLQEQLPLGAIRQEAESLLAQGRLGSHHLHEAMQAVFERRLSAQAASAVTHICASISDLLYRQGNTERNLAGPVNFLAADTLSEGQDLLSRRLAVEHYDAALRHFAPDDPDYPKAQINQAVTLCALADLGDCPVERLLAALDLFRKAQESPGLAPSAQHECSVGIAKASVQLSQAGRNPIANLEAALEPSKGNDGSLLLDAGHAERFVNEAVTRISIADYGQMPILNLRWADELLGRALPALTPNSHSYGTALLNKGVVQYRLAQHGLDPGRHLADAVDYFLRCREHLDPQHSAYLRALENEATARSLLGILKGDSAQQFHAALECCREAHERLTKAGKPVPGNLLVNEGVIIVRMAERADNPAGMIRRALGLFQTAAAVLPCEHPEWGTARRNEGRALWQLGDLGSAQRALDEGLRAFERLRGQMRREHERTGFWETIVHEYGEMVELCLALAESPAPSGGVARPHWNAEAWHWVHRAKSRSLLEVLSRDSLRVSPESQRLYEEVRALSRELDVLERALRHRPPREDATGQAGDPRAGNPLEDRRGRRDTVRGWLRNASERLLRAVESAGAVGMADVPPTDEVIRHLQQLARPSPGESDQDVSQARKTLLVELFMLDPRRLVAFLLPLWQTAEPVARTFTLPGPTVVDLARSVSDAVAKLRATTRARVAAESPVVSERERREARKRLSQLPENLSSLVEPWADLLRSWQPTELLLSPHYFTNLLPLHAASFDGKPLIEHFPVAYLPTASLAGEVLRRRRSSGASAVLVGNPTQDLSSADVEVRNVSRWLADYGIGHHTLVGCEATTESAQAHAAVASVVHFAGHSVLEPSDFFRSGLELADGRLTALEMRLGLELRNATLVYLSSCDSGLAIPGRTDDLMGLARLFFAAGSPTTVASLWAVDDAAACSFADYFYRSWVGHGETAGGALCKATRALRQDLPNPFYWAPFVLLGAWNWRVAGRADPMQSPEPSAVAHTEIGTTAAGHAEGDE